MNFELSFKGFLNLLNDVGAYVQSAVDVLRFIYTTPEAKNAPAGFALILLVVFIVAIAVVYIASLMREKKITQVTGRLSAIPVGELGQHLDVLNRDLRDHSVIGHAWEEFAETLERGTVAEPDVVYITRRPVEYFNIYDTKCQNKALTSLMPTLFVTTGLVLTFLGLIIALGAAGGLLSSPEATGTASSGAGAQGGTSGLEGLQALLSAAGAKFYTSVAGLIASFIAHLVGAVRVRSTDGALMGLCTQLERHTHFLTSQKLAKNNSEQFAGFLGQFNRQMDQLATNISDRLSEAMPSSIVQKLEPVVANMQPALTTLENLPTTLADALSAAIGPTLEELRGSMGNLSTAGADNLDALVRQMSADLRASTAEQTNAVNIQLTRAAESLSGVATSLAGSGTHLRQEIGGSVDQLSASLAQMGPMLEQALTTATGSLAGAGEQAGTALSERVAASAGQLTTAVDGIGPGMQAAVACAGESLVNAGASAGQQLQGSIDASVQSLTGAMQSATGSLSGASSVASNELRNAGTAVSAAMTAAVATLTAAQAGAASATTGAGEEAARAIQSAAATMANELTNASSGLTHRLTDLQQRTQALTVSMERASGNLSSYGDAISGASGEVVTANTALKSSTDAIRTTLSPLAKTTEDLTAGVGGLREAHEAVRSAQERLSANITTVVERLGANSEMLETLDEKLEPAFTAMAGRINETGDLLTEQTNNVDKALAEAANALRAAIDDLNEGLDDFATKLRRP